MKKFVADFETATWLEDETYVWAWALCNIEDPDEIIIGNTIESFFEKIQEENYIIYFHNLKFDASFIIDYLLKNDYVHIEDKNERRDKTFSTLISDMGIFYSVEIYFKVSGKVIKRVSIFDSLKIIPISVDGIPDAFGIPYTKLNLDYNRPREKGYILKPYEERYIKNDVKIVALALKEMFNENLTKMTIGSNALANFKKTKGLYFKRLFPEINLELYEDLKKAYKGGFTFLNKIYEEKDNEETIILDVNSLYPSQMRYKPMPYGEPIFYKGEYKEDKIYPLYIQRLCCSFELKSGKIPTIQIKGRPFFQENEYLESSNGEVIALTLTNIDLKLFLENYNVYNLEYWSGWKFKALNGIFDEYIDYWISVKNEATLENNKGKRQIAKLMLNSLYGKFASKMKGQNKIPYLENGKVLYKLSDEEERKGVYIPIGAFITSYAREVTIRTSGLIKEYSLNKYGIDKYIYSDTDSIHTTLSIEELSQFCDIDPVRLGAWKHEGTARRSKFIRQKTYLEEIFNKKTNEWEVKITCAGMPKSCYKYVEWNTFKQGFTCKGKLTYKQVKGGVKLVDTDFTIKSDKLKKNFKKF